MNSEPVFIAMSGGVDSSVAALLLHQQGYSPIGVSMQVWDYRQNGGSCSRSSCCAPSDFNDARMVAGKLCIPYYVFDFESTFREQVIDRFVSDYLAGVTPNPCVECNNKVKFRMLRDQAERMGVKLVSTGHYAKVATVRGKSRLFRARDSAKDQTYFLSGIRSHEIESTLFPLAELTKPEVRELAREFGLATADKPESQDICFVSGSAGDFVAKIGALKNSRGVVVDRTGKVLAQHEGVHHYTVGQRRGLNLGGESEPLYVVEIDAANQKVVVGPKQDLSREGFTVGELNAVSPDLAEQIAKGNFPVELQAIAQVRHRHSGVKVQLTITGLESAQAKFTEEWAVVAPGQTATFYDLENCEVLAGGKIQG